MSVWLVRAGKNGEQEDFAQWPSVPAHSITSQRTRKEHGIRAESNGYVRTSRARLSDRTCSTPSVAGKGAMGFDLPRLCVQVKSGKTPVDVKVFRELRGVMEDRGADQGLLVSWSGFTRPAVEEARRQFFRVRLWDAGKLVDKVLHNYEKLSEELRAELPLKRIWVLVPEDA